MALIAVSGVDGSGKSTQIELLDKALTERGALVSVRWFRPGYGPVAERVKKAMRLPSAASRGGEGQDHSEGAEIRDAMMRRGSVRLLWLMFAALDSIIETAFIARVKARSGCVVIYDRWIFDALLDLQVNFPDWPLVVRAIGAVLKVVGRDPDMSVLIVVSQDVARSRLATKAEPFPDSDTVASRRRLAYERYALQHPDQALCGEGPQGIVHRRLWGRAEVVCP